MSTYDIERHINISLDIEGIGMDGYIGACLDESIFELVEKRKITLEATDNYLRIFLPILQMGGCDVSFYTD